MSSDQILFILCILISCGLCSEFVQKIAASDATNWDHFGRSVSLSNNTIVIGSRYDNNNWIDGGSAYIFTQTDSSWIQTAKLEASTGANRDHFGDSVCISNSGHLIAVGAVDDDDNGAESGSVYIFMLDSINNLWIETIKLLASDGAANDRFGDFISISDEFIVIGAFNANDEKGAVYIFNYSWIETAKLVASDGAVNDRFGDSVSISHQFIAVGAPQDDDNGIDSGSVYIFKIDPINDIWLEIGKLTPSDGATNDLFGAPVHFSNSADFIVIGAKGDDDNGDDSGSVYIFNRNGTSDTWLQSTKLLASDGAANDMFGISISIAISSHFILIGASAENNNMGSAYIFQRDIMNDSIWTETVKLIAPDRGGSDLFGTAVSISDDYAVVGAYGDDDDGTNSGSVYIFTTNDPTTTSPTNMPITALPSLAPSRYPSLAPSIAPTTSKTTLSPTKSYKNLHFICHYNDNKQFILNFLS
eukprot:226716_1